MTGRLRSRLHISGGVSRRLRAGCDQVTAVTTPPTPTRRAGVAADPWLLPAAAAAATAAAAAAATAAAAAASAHTTAAGCRCHCCRRLYRNTMSTVTTGRRHRRRALISQHRPRPGNGTGQIQSIGLGSRSDRVADSRWQAITNAAVSWRSVTPPNRVA